ncbi:MAG: rhomboid family intramembrane serine protease [Mycobacteriales bacterium]
MVLPIHDDNPTRRIPWVTYLLIVINLVVFLLEPISRLAIDGDPPIAQACRQEAFFRRWGAIPRELSSGKQHNETFAPAGTESCEVVRPSYRKSPVLSVLYALFLHGGWLHLIGNMLFLFVFGNNVEDRLGRLAFLAFYLVSGYVATYVFAFSDPQSLSTLVGASGAIAGVLGAYLVLFPRARVLSLVPFLLFLPFRLPAWVVLGSWFALQYVYSRGAALTAGSGVAYSAHVAGFVFGFLALLAGRRRLAQHPRSAYGGRR